MSRHYQSHSRGDFKIMLQVPRKRRPPDGDLSPLSLPSSPTNSNHLTNLKALDNYLIDQITTRHCSGIYFKLVFFYGKWQHIKLKSTKKHPPWSADSNGMWLISVKLVIQSCMSFTEKIVGNFPLKSCITLSHAFYLLNKELCHSTFFR